MKNERITEDMVEDLLRRQGFYSKGTTASVEKQKTGVAALSKALSKASKKRTGASGSPEFIITDSEAPDLVVVVECKADIKRHESADRDRPSDYAVDGVLHYARHLSPVRTVIAIAVSGDSKSSKWSFFLVPRGETEPRELRSPTGAPITAMVPMADLIRGAAYDPAVQALRTNDLIAFSMEMHEFMRDEAELEEKEKPLVVAGSLIALSNDVFATTYDAYPATELPGFWMESIKKEMEKAKLPNAKVLNLTQPFTAVEVHPELGKSTKPYPKGLLNEIVGMLAEKVLPFLTVYHDFDVVGQFYGEFLKYTGGDGKGLGIVLTPKHVTELFSLLANVTKTDVVIDTCAGTGSFLISAMAKMASTATTEAEINSIKKRQLVGVEQNPTMYALAASNMYLRGDGKANLYQGSCFDEAIGAAVKRHRATVGLINPPYAKTKADLSELRFVERLLDSLVKGGLGVAVIPVSCVTAPSQEKRDLLEKHTLEAVMSMPPELFYPVGAVTCIVVFTAGIPHATSAKKTWFGYWREDGFVKVKNLGRVDKFGKWPAIRDRWVEMFRNREVHAGSSVMAQVGPEDEWVAEAYMETDYSNLTQADFEKVLMNYALFVARGTVGSTDVEGDDE